MSDHLDRLAGRARDDLTGVVDAGAAPPPPAASVARRAARRRARHGSLAVTAAILAGATALWATSDDDSSSKVVAGPPERDAHPPATTGAPPAVALDSEAPPPLKVRSDSRAIEAAAYGFCWSPADGGSPLPGLCADGMPPAEPPDIGAADHLTVTAPWAAKVTASTRTPGQPCSRSFPVTVDRQPDGTFRLSPAGYPSASDVYLSAKGPNGSAEYLFRWTTTVRGPLPEPSARAAIVTGAWGAPRFGGTELAIDQLARTPTVAIATVTVTAANGESTSLAPVRAPDTCRPEGSLYWTGLPGEARPPLEGPAPFRYDVTVTLDDVRHTATATWPDDQIDGFEPNVALHFQPPLPGLQ